MSRTSDTYRGVTYANGRMPSRLRGRVDGRHGTSRELTAYLRADAAAALNRCMAEGEAAGLAPLHLRGWYRPLSEQLSVFWPRVTRTPNGRPTRTYGGVTYYLRGAAVATPGWSNHGLGTAIDCDDFGGVGNWSDPHQLAWTPYLERHGFTDTEGRDIGEPWHRVYDPATDRGKNTPTETKDWFDMATEAQLRKIVDAEGEQTRRYLREYVDRALKYHPQVPDVKAGKNGKVPHVVALGRLLILGRQVRTVVRRNETLNRRNEALLRDLSARLAELETKEA